MPLSVENKTAPEKMATSKINWTQYVAVIATVGSLVGIDMTPEQQVSVVVTIQLVANFVTWVLRTFFTHPPA